MQPYRDAYQTDSEAGNAAHTEGVAEATKPYAKKIIKAYNRQIVFPTKRLETEADVDAYVEMVRGQLKTLMKNCDGIELK